MKKYSKNFYEHYRKEKQVGQNGRKYILFRIDVYFTKYLIDIEIEEKVHTDRDLILEGKRQAALEKNLVVNSLELIRVNKVEEYKHLSVNLKTDN